VHGRFSGRSARDRGTQVRNEHRRRQRLLERSDQPSATLFVALGATMTVPRRRGRTVPAEVFLGVYIERSRPGRAPDEGSGGAGKQDGFASVPIGGTGRASSTAAASSTATAWSSQSAAWMRSDRRAPRVERTRLCQASRPDAGLKSARRRPRLCRLSPPPWGGARRCARRAGERGTSGAGLTPDDHVEINAKGSSARSRHAGS